MNPAGRVRGRDDMALFSRSGQGVESASPHATGRPLSFWCFLRPLGSRRAPGPASAGRFHARASVRIRSIKETMPEHAPIQTVENVNMELDSLSKKISNLEDTLRFLHPKKIIP
jgi:hypothetical protein